MTVKEILRECQNGTQIEVIDTVYHADGDDSTTVLEGVVGTFGRIECADREISYIGVRANTLVIHVSRLKA